MGWMRRLFLKSTIKKAMLRAVTIITIIITGTFSIAEEKASTVGKTANSVATDSVEPNSIEAKLMRFPDISKKSVVFCYAGDIWKAPLKGGTAIRLTAHEGLELFPRFSPDGKWIAFTGQYDGDEQVYVIPAEGGIPRQLSFYPAAGPFPPRRGYDNIVYGWTPDGKKVLFRSLRDSNSVTELGTLYTVALDGSMPEKLPIPTAGAGDFSPDGKKIVYSPLFRDFRSWKRYEGGWAQYLTLFDLETGESKRLDKNPRTEREPMWIGDAIYFVSDRTGTMNLFKYELENEHITQLTGETVWDVRWASADSNSGTIVYELGGELYVYDTKAAHAGDAVQKIPVRIPHDGLAMRPSRLNVSKSIESYSLAPGGKRAAVIARGDLFTVPTEKGFVKNRSNSSNAHERCPVWSRDGKTIAYISDAGGEDQVYLADSKNESRPVPLTGSFKGQLDRLRMSPCGRYLCVSHCDAKLFIVPTVDIPGEGGDILYKKGVPVEIVRETNGGTPAGVWSPCGEYLAFILHEPQGFGVLHVCEVATREIRRITDPMFDVDSPAWDPAGNFIYYLSRREFAPQFSSVEWNFAGNRDIGIFAVALRKDVKNPFGPQSDEIDTADDDSARDDSSRPKDASEKHVSAGREKQEYADLLNRLAKAFGDLAKTHDKALRQEVGENNTAGRGKTKIDWDNLARRVVRVPVPFENYENLEATEKFLVYIKGDASFYGREPALKPTLMYFDLKERKEYAVEDPGVGGYEISPDGSRMIFNVATTLKICDLKPKTEATVVPTGELALDRIPSREWEEMFNETWRKFRDFFYARNMHGYDWEKIGAQYRELLPFVAHRSDLNYVLSEMVSELNVGHAYIQGGDFVQPDRPKSGLPGCRFELDTASNRYRIAKIFRGSNEEAKYRSPLTEIGVDAKEGDFVLAIDGIELDGTGNPYRLLRHRGDPVTLTLNEKPTFEGARKTTYVPIANEGNLLYLDFVYANMEKVSKATDGRVGYIHIPDMGVNGSYEFLKWYYPQIRKAGLVIDDRSNGGGNISQWIIMRLNQKLLGTRFGSVRETPVPYPGNARFGVQVCLVNETSASDGDIFPYYFRKSGLGPLIGKRTWGGVVGISPRGQLLDGGVVFVPLQATNDEVGNWIIEGTGVEPDIEVDNDPKSMLEGRDPQLERGIEEVLKLMKEKPHVWPNRPAEPVKNKG